MKALNEIIYSYATVTSVAMAKDVGCYWMERVKRIRRNVGTKWGISQTTCGHVSNHHLMGISCVPASMRTLGVGYGLSVVLKVRPH